MTKRFVEFLNDNKATLSAICKDLQVEHRQEQNKKMTEFVKNKCKKRGKLR